MSLSRHSLGLLDNAISLFINNCNTRITLNANGAGVASPHSTKKDSKMGNFVLTDLGGVPGRRPPKDPDSFVSTYKIFKT